MTEPSISGQNTPSSIGARYRMAGLRWWPVLLRLPARLVFAFIAQGAAVGLFAVLGVDEPDVRAPSCWPVYSTITDVLSLAALVWLTRREGLGLLDLLGVERRQIVRQLL